MKIVFMGTPEFAVPSLEAISREHEIVAVITAPDKPAGRGKKLSTSAVKQKALELGISVMQPTNLKDPDFLSELKDLSADLFVVLAFRMLPEQVWAMPPKGTINLHASLLPNFRGAAPINRAIMQGEKKTGLTTFFIEKEIDTGKIIDQLEINIGEDETAGDLHDRMMFLGAELLLKTIADIEKGETSPVEQPQGASKLKTAPKIFKEDCQINWERSAVEIHNHVRGLSPYPAAWTKFADQTTENEVFKIFRTALADSKSIGEPGTTYREKDKLFVQCARGKIELIEVQAAGKKRLAVGDFLRGFPADRPIVFS